MEIGTVTTSTAQHQSGAKHRVASTDREMKRAAKAQRRAARSTGVKLAIAVGKGLGIALGLVVIVVGVVGVMLLNLALGTKGQLEAAKDKIDVVVDLAKDLDVDGVTRTLSEIDGHMAEAVRLTSDPLWQFAESLPSDLINQNMVAVRETAKFADDMVDEAMPYIQEFLPLLNTSNLKSPDGGFNLDPLVRANEILPEVEAIMTEAEIRLNGIGRGDEVISMLTEELDKLRGALTEVKPLLEEAKELLPAVLPLLGSEGKRNYLLMFQNNAEVRSLGGLPSAVALISVNKGKIKLERQASTLDFHACCMWTDNLDLPAEVKHLYPANMTRILGDVTMRPDFPTAAQIATNMWKKQYGDRIDAVLSIDPVTLSYFLESTGPIKLAGKDVLTSDNALKLLLSEVYTRYHQMDKRGIDDFFADAAKRIFNALAGGSDDDEVNPIEVAATSLRDAAKQDRVEGYFLRAMARVIKASDFQRGVDYVDLIKQAFRAADEGRVFAYSTKPAEKALIERFNLSGVMLKSNKENTQVGVFFNDSSISKLSYYLTTSIEIIADRCPDKGQPTITAKVKIKSNVPKNGAETLPVYVKANAGTLKRTGHSAYMRVSTVFYGARGGELTSVPPAKGYSAGFYNRIGKDMERPVAAVDTTLGPGESRTLTFVQKLKKGSNLGPILLRHTAMMGDTPTKITEKSSCPNDPPVTDEEPDEQPKDEPAVAEGALATVGRRD